MIPTLILFLFPLAYSPGPGNLFFAAQGARFGVLSTLRANLGYHLATFAVTALIGFGAVSAAADAPRLFMVLRALGAAYVLWLALRLARAGVIDSAPDARPAGVFDGAALLLLNPKAYAIIALMFSQFAGLSSLGPVREVLMITAVFTLNNCIAFGFWTLAGARLAALFQAKASARVLNIGFGVLLGLVALWMLWL